MAAYTIVNLDEVQDVAPTFGMPPGIEARFARDSLECEKSGMSLFRFEPNYRVPFGHKHTDQEELYVVVSGSGRIKIEDEIVELGTWNAVRLPPQVSRGFESGPDGAVVLAFGAGLKGDGEIMPGWWAD